MEEMDRPEIRLPDWELLPDIGLYMDQVVTLMERTLGGALPKGEITKSMVNNYVKAGLLPRPAGKKYEREHLALLLMICVLKQALSMEHIGALLRSLCKTGIKEGYARFRQETERIGEGLSGGNALPRLMGQEPKEQALLLGITAAICTLHASRILEKQDAKM